MGIKGLKNHFLVSMPSINDPIFKRSIILICRDTKEGSMGLIINKPIDNILKTTQFENQLELMELAHSTGEIKDDQNDPIAMKLYNHYLAIQKELSQARQDEQKSEEPQRKIEELRKLAFQSLLEELELENPGSQTHEDAWKHERFIANLDDSVKDTITTQLNSTYSPSKEKIEVDESYYVLS